ncbi:methyltransferase domain-containing protein [Lyngbya aestuarii]|uniref:methyltransferase domain-containing protein n=1 Tax=Lyngbya aestuarii TaxID=118322 RepID=UPI00403D7461
MTNLYWLGNAAKTKVIYEILNQVQDNQKTVIFDYGCGKAGDWPRILSDYPHIRLVAYEPGKKSIEIARERLKSFNAELFTGTELHEMKFKADFVVSFSVFEHVYNRTLYLQTAKKHLADQGIFYLNYDDGHFRNFLDLNRPDLWLSQIKEWLHNLLAMPLAQIGIVGGFQQRVYQAEVDDLVKSIGFKTLDQFYSNLSSLKGLQKYISPARQEDFSKFWLDIENTLNTKFNEEGGISRGDSANLWQVMVSRTLVLGHL